MGNFSVSRIVILLLNISLLNLIPSNYTHFAVLFRSIKIYFFTSIIYVLIFSQFNWIWWWLEKKGKDNKSMKEKGSL
jgi:hypothetical protein